MIVAAKWLTAFSIVAALSAGAVHTARAQEAPPPHQQVISANPFGLLLEFFNAEYERTITGSSTVGVGGSFFSREEFDYLNADVFWRFYPQGRPIEGWAFGAKVGLTSVPEQGTFFGYGFDLNRSWVLGPKDNFYVGLGFGLKRLVGTDGEAFEVGYIPTFRVVNVGYVF